MANKSNFLRWIVTFALVSTFIAAEQTEAAPAGWTMEKGVVGQESFTVTFPKKAKNKSNDHQYTLHASDGNKALYIITTPNPSLESTQAEIAFEIFRKVNNEAPKKVTSWLIHEKNGCRVMDLETYNSNTRNKTKIRYIATKNNIWELKTAYAEESDQHHQEFVDSFQISQ